jgi:hypothetical protein
MAAAICVALAGKSQLPTFSNIFSFWAGSDKAALPWRNLLQHAHPVP